MMRNTKRIYSQDYIEEIAYNLIRGFSILQERRIYHQDVKPHNIFVTQKDGVRKYKIAEFNVSRAADPQIGTIAMSVVSKFNGTYGYISPELQKLGLNTNSKELIEVLITIL